MKSCEYQNIYALEDSHWWYCHLRSLVLAALKRFLPDPSADLKLLDAGCGTGGLLRTLTSSTYHRLIGMDISAEALKFCQLRSLKGLVQASVTYLPFKKESLDVIISLDVVTFLDREEDRERAIKGILDVLKKGGIFIFNLPAYNFLKSEHDKAIGMKYRFGKKDIRRYCLEYGWSLETLFYWNSFLFPIIFIIRIVKKFHWLWKAEAESDLKPLPDHVNRLLLRILSWERRLLKNKDPIFGLSLFGVLKK